MAKLLAPPPKFTVYYQGTPASGAKVNVYLTGTSTRTDTYSTRGGTVNANPVICDSRGECSIFLTAGKVYDFVVTTSSDVAIYTQTGITPNSADTFNAENYGAVGDGSTDDTAALQAMIDAAILDGAEKCFIPSGTYKTTAPLTATKALSIYGSGIGCTIMGTGLSAGQYVLDLNCITADNVNGVVIEGITFRSNNGTPNGVRVKNVNYLTMRDCWLYNVLNGISIQGTVCYSNLFDHVTCYTIGGTGVKFESFTGGGHYKFSHCTFSGVYGVNFDSSSSINNLEFDTCNWESCSTQSMLISGTVEGLSITAPRTEGGSGSDFVIYPTAANHVYGLSITGGFFNQNTAASPPIVLGGNTGLVNGFLISGNNFNITTTYAVHLNGGGDYGRIDGNFVNTATGTIVNALRPTVTVGHNGNTAGAIRVGEIAWTPTDGSGAGLTFSAASATYKIVDGTLFWRAYVIYPATGDGSNASIAGLPFAVPNTFPGRTGASAVSDAGVALGLFQGSPTSTKVGIYNPTSLAAIVNSALSGKTVYLSGSYPLA